MKFAVVVFLASLVFVSRSLAAAVDLIIVNANVRTMASAQPRAEAIAVSGGEIVAVGSTKTIRLLADKDTKVIDAGGKLVIPGFNDAHVHFASIGQIFSSIKLSDIRAAKEFTERFARFGQFLPKGRWILGSGWDNRNWIPNDPPTRKLIDAATPDNPVMVYSYDPDLVLVNAAALKLAAVDENTKDPPAGKIFRDSDGNPTGILRGEAIDLVKKLVPSYHMTNMPEIVETATNFAASLGVTSVHDVQSDDLLPVLRELREKGKLKTRVYDCTTLLDWKKRAEQGVKAVSGDAMIRTGCLKFYAENDETETLEQDIAGADKAGMQVAIHAIGSGPNKFVLDSFEKVIEENGKADRRFRVEHAQGFRAADPERFSRSNVIASVQPWLFFREAGPMSETFKQMFEAKIPVAFGSDAPIAEIDPLLSIYAAVNGRNGISVEQAVHAYTVGSAYAEFQEKVKGTIEVGKLADIVILSDDIFSIEKAKIKEAKVELTIVEGKVVFQKK